MKISILIMATLTLLVFTAGSVMAEKSIIEKSNILNGSSNLRTTEPVFVKQPSSNDYPFLEESLVQTISDNNMSPTIPRLSAKVNKNTAKIEILMGTWQFSYTMNGESYSDKITIDNVYTGDDGSINGTGYWYLNQQEDASLASVCVYDPTAFSSFGGDYLCLSKVSLSDGTRAYQIITLKFSGNNITSGYYGLDTDILGAFKDISNSPKQIRGNRLTSSFDSNTGELILPGVQVGDTNFALVFDIQKNDLFRLKSYKINHLAPYGSADIYSINTGKLILPRVQVGANNYSLVFVNLGDYVFQLESYQDNYLTPQPSTDQSSSQGSSQTHSENIYPNCVNNKYSIEYNTFTQQNYFYCI